MSGVLGWVVGVPIAIVFMVVCNRYLFLSGTKVRRYKIVSGRRVRDYAAESALTAATTPPRRGGASRPGRQHPKRSRCGTSESGKQHGNVRLMRCSRRSSQPT